MTSRASDRESVGTPSNSPSFKVALASSSPVGASLGRDVGACWGTVWVAAAAVVDILAVCGNEKAKA